MFQRFLEYFEIYDIVIQDIDPYKAFLKAFSGLQFGNGLFTVFKEEDINMWQENVLYAFPISEERVSLFGYDWQGNCFGIAKDEKNSGKVILFEIGTGEILSTDCYFEDFINNEIPFNSESCLAGQFYKEWLNNEGESPIYGRCIGYKVPLFMGGKDDITNLEDGDMDVYWSVLSQAIHKLRVNR